MTSEAKCDYDMAKTAFRYEHVVGHKEYIIYGP